MDQQEAWERFYAENHRPWRGVSSMPAIPFPKGSKVLEVGCGNGKTAAALTDQGYKVTGLDFSQSAVDMCSGSIASADFVCGSVTDLPFEDASFSGCVIFHVLEHLTRDEMDKAVSEIARVLVPGSHAIVRCFAKGDMRSEKGTRIDDSTVVRGNGILYHYFDEEELVKSFSPFECIGIRTKEESTRFGETRRRIEADFRLKDI